MKIEVRAVGADGPLAFKTFTDTRTVYAWDRVLAKARFVRVTLPGEKRKLSAAEVKVFVRDLTGTLCTDKTCAGGRCLCADAACSRQACKCGPDRMGPDGDCAFNPLRDWRYLPLQTHGPHASWDKAKWAELRAELKANQNPKSCKPAYGFSGLIGSGGRGAGLASTLHFLGGQLSEGYNQKRAAVFGGIFNYAGTKHCKAKGMFGDFDCYFKHLAGGGCLGLKQQLRKRYKPPAVRKKQPNRCPIDRLCNDVSHFRTVPKKYEEQGLFWWRTAMVAYLLAPNREMEEILQLERLKAEIGFAGKVIGVHVRHGDACHTTDRKGRCKGLAYYLPEIRVLAERYNTKKVFLATDDQKVVDQARKLSGEFKFIFINFNRGVLNNKNQIEYRKNLWDGSNDHGFGILKSSLMDLLLLAECDYLVLHNLSNMSRLALELAAARLQRVPPFISVDGPWCNHWKMCRS